MPGWSLNNIGRGFAGPTGAWAVLVLGATACWSDVLLNRPQVVPNGTVAGFRSAEMDFKLDPNVATAGELSAIVGLGEKHAQDIVDYRTRMQASHPDKPVFLGVGDLEGAKGIGAQTARIAGPYLIFPDRPAGMPDVVVTKRKSKN